MRKFARWVAPVALALGGCVITPQPVVYRQAAPAPQAVWAQESYVPPLDYVEGGAPVYYANEPGIAYYPIFIDTPGSCFCIVPMRYAAGVWVGVGGVVVHRGEFHFHRPEPYHRDMWIRSGGVINGYAPLRGRVENVGGVYRPLPPPGSVHERHGYGERGPGGQASQPSGQYPREEHRGPGQVQPNPGQPGGYAPQPGQNPRDGGQEHRGAGQVQPNPGQPGGYAPPPGQYPRDGGQERRGAGQVQPNPGQPGGYSQPSGQYSRDGGQEHRGAGQGQPGFVPPVQAAPQVRQPAPPQAVPVAAPAPQPFVRPPAPVAPQAAPGAAQPGAQQGRPEHPHNHCSPEEHAAQKC